MSRVKRGVTAKKKHKKILQLTKGHYGARSRVYRVAKQSALKASVYAYRDRKVKKRTFRSLWIARINAAVRTYDMTYSVFMNALKRLNLTLDRKVLSDIAINNKEDFRLLVQEAKKVTTAV